MNKKINSNAEIVKNAADNFNEKFDLQINKRIEKK